MKFRQVDSRPILLPIVLIGLIVVIDERIVAHRIPEQCHRAIKCTIFSRKYEVLEPPEVSNYPCLKILRDSVDSNEDFMTSFTNFNNDIKRTSLRKVISSNQVFYRRRHVFNSYKLRYMEPELSPFLYRPNKHVHPDLEYCLNIHCRDKSSSVVLTCQNSIINSVVFNWGTIITKTCIDNIHYLDFRGTNLKNVHSKYAFIQFENVYYLNNDCGTIDEYHVFYNIFPKLTVLKVSEEYSFDFWTNVTSLLVSLAEINTPTNIYWIFGIYYIDVYNIEAKTIKTVDFRKPETYVNIIQCLVDEGHETKLSTDKLDSNENNYFLALVFFIVGIFIVPVLCFSWKINIDSIMSPNENVTV